MPDSSNIPLSINQLPISEEFPQEDVKLLSETVTKTYKNISNAVNSKTGGLFSPLEYGNFDKYFTQNDPTKFREVYRKVFDMVDLNGGNIPTNTTVQFAHNIDGIVAPVKIYGAATVDPTTYVPLPFVGNNQPANIEIEANDTQIILRNGNKGEISQAYIVFEYLKQ